MWVLIVDSLIYFDSGLAQENKASDTTNYQFSFGLGGVGTMQQDNFPLEFGTGLRLFWGWNGFQRLTIELAADVTFNRKIPDDEIFVFGDNVITFGFSKGYLINVDWTGKIAFLNRLRNSPYFLLNFGLTVFEASDGKAVNNVTLAVKDENASVSGFYLGAGIGYKHHLTTRLFVDFNAVFDYVIIESATGGDKTSDLNKSIKSPAEIFIMQLGYDFNF